MKESIGGFTFMSLIVVRASLASISSPIMDCDETFNYIEPLHYLLDLSSTHEHDPNGDQYQQEIHLGFQTWEYSPNYALRSWFYIVLHFVPLKMLSKMFMMVGYLPSSSLDLSKPLLFVILRAMIGICCAYAESTLIVSIHSHIGKLTAWITFVFLMMAPGMFHAGVALLPSSTAMMAVMMSYSHWIPILFSNANDGKSESGIDVNRHAFLALLWGSFAVLVCWPFCALMFVPMGFHCLFRSGFGTIVKTVIAALILFVGIPVVVDSWYYDKFTVAVANLILYNVMGQGGGGKGANLYGVEPWTFYAKNLLLNLNLIAVFGIAIAPISSVVFRNQRNSFLLLILPMFMTLALFTSMEHKEERFLSMIYPVCALSAAYSVSSIYFFLTKRLNLEIIGGAFVSVIVVVVIVVSSSRILALVYGFGAPQIIYAKFYYDMMYRNPVLSSDPNLCVGKEWHRFPSHFFIPRNVEVRWVKSSFSGLLPTQFEIYPYGLSSIPKHVNDANREEPRLYVDISRCDYFVDLLMPGTSPDNSIEILNKNNPTHQWKRVYCSSFLSSDESPSPWRSFYIPPELFKSPPLVYRPYCLFYSAPKQLTNQSVTENAAGGDISSTKM